MYNIKEIEGKTIKQVIESDKNRFGMTSSLLFVCEDDAQYTTKYIMECLQDENDGAEAWLDKVDGEYNDIIGAKVLFVQKNTVSYFGKEKEALEIKAKYNLKSYEARDYITWTFYEIQTTKGNLFLKWWGNSRDISVEVDFYKIMS